MKPDRAITGERRVRFLTGSRAIGANTSAALLRGLFDAEITFKELTTPTRDNVAKYCPGGGTDGLDWLH